MNFGTLAMALVVVIAVPAATAGYAYAVEAGLRFLPLSLCAFVVAAISGNLTSRVSSR